MSERSRSLFGRVLAISMLVSLSGAAVAQISFVQVKSAAATSGSSIAVAYTNAQAAGNLNVVAVMWGDTTSTVSSVTDSRGNTYALAVGPTRVTGLSSSIYYAKNIAAGSNTVTVTFNQTAGFPNVNVLEYSGLSTTSPLDVTAGATGTGTTANSGSATTTSANELIVGMGNPTGSGFTAAGSGFTSRIINSFGGISEDKIVTSTGSYNATATLNSGTWVMQMAAFRASGGGNPAPTVTAISPPSGTTAGGTPVTITGTGFLAGATVSLGGTAATGVTVVSSTSITATTPAHAAGAANVVVTNTDTQSGTLTNGYTYSSGTPTVTGMTPNQGAVGVEVSITGTNLGASGSVTFNGLSATPWSWGPTLITVPVPLGTTSGNVVVTVSGVPLSAGSFNVLSQVPSTATEFSYDSMGRVSQALICTPMNCGTGGGVAMSYIYDLAGKPSSISSYGGITLQYIPDGADRVSQVTSSWADAQHPATLATVDPSVGYYPTGALRKVALANNLTDAAVYNNRLQPCRINVNSSGTLLSTCSDALPSGNVQDYSASFIAGSNNGNVGGVTATGQQQSTRTYGYDSLNRLQSMSAPGDGCSGLSWTYDGWGNRTAQNVTGGSCFSSSNAGNTKNQLIGAPYQYDAAGNLLNDGNHTYTYDAENRITTVDGGTTATYVYDAFGKRVGRTVSGRDDEYIYDNEGHINSVLGNGLLERMYLYMNGQPLAEYFETTTYFVHSDRLGSTRLLTRLDQTVRESDDYYPFGEQIPPTGGTAGTLKFTGKERDAESGLDNFGARYNASTVGRFMTPDTKLPSRKFLMNPQKWNKYAYVLNNPLSLVDPDGMEEKTIVYRTFIAPATLNFLGTTYAGDNRGFSSAANASSRSTITVRIETDPSIRPGNPIISQTSSAGESRKLDANGNTISSATQTQGLPTATGTRDANGDAVVGISQDVKNPLSPGPQMLTPGITASMTMSFTPDGSSVSTTGTASNFPSQELNVTGANGTTTPVFQCTPSPGSNPFSLFLPDRKVNCTTSTPAEGGSSSSCH
jgi:RHS repeat-associated protein